MDPADRERRRTRGGKAPLTGEDREQLRRGLDPAWQVVAGHHLEREYRFPDFRTAFGFVARIAELAEAVNHHPELELAWGRVRLTIWTHAVDGLTESDFAFAAEADRLLSG